MGRVKHGCSRWRALLAGRDVCRCGDWHPCEVIRAGLASDRATTRPHRVAAGVVVDEAQARDILRLHRPVPWCWWLLGRLATCRCCGQVWRCAPVLRALSYLDRVGVSGRRYIEYAGGEWR
jgi:hypothetical protein